MSTKANQKSEVDELSLSEIFREMRDHRKSKRAENFIKNHERIKSVNLPCELKNEGHHVIFLGKFKYDFWPASGKFLNRKTNKYGRGFSHLISTMLEQESMK